MGVEQKDMSGQNPAYGPRDGAAGASELPKDKVLVLDFGSQVSHLICRRIREANVYSELMSCTESLDKMKAFGPKGVILSGGPSSVYEEGSPHVPDGFFNWVIQENLPLLGICYGLQEMSHQNGGKVEPGEKKEYGHAMVTIREKDNLLFKHCDTNEVKCWMSHGDKVTALPAGFKTVASTDNCEFAAVAATNRKWWGLQYHPEVTHTHTGGQMIKNFVCDPEGCGCAPGWSMADYLAKQQARIKQMVEQKEKEQGAPCYVVAALSGGVDSTVGGCLVAQAVPQAFRPIFVDTGLLRLDERGEVEKRLGSIIGDGKLLTIDASETFYSELKGVTDPEKKRKVIGRLFIETFDQAVKEMNLNPEHCFLLQGTLYPDVIESTSFKGPSSVIKSHHNVGGLPDKMKMTVMEPLRLLFKDEVRTLGRQLGIPKESVMRHPFPGPGLAIRIIGEVNRMHADILRQADDIFIKTLRSFKTGDQTLEGDDEVWYDKSSQAFVVLMPDVKTVGVQGDGRTYFPVCCIRCVNSSDFMTADWTPLPYKLLHDVSDRIVNECEILDKAGKTEMRINRVCYDLTSKPPGTIEWE